MLENSVSEPFLVAGSVGLGEEKKKKKVFCTVFIYVQLKIGSTLRGHVWVLFC